MRSDVYLSGLSLDARDALGSFLRSEIIQMMSQLILGLIFQLSDRLLSIFALAQANRERDSAQDPQSDSSLGFSEGFYCDLSGIFGSKQQSWWCKYSKKYQAFTQFFNPGAR